MKTKNIIGVCIISLLILTSITCFLVVDWDEVEEYRERYSPASGISSPMPPYVLEQTIGFISSILSIMLIILYVLENCINKGEKK